MSSYDDDEVNDDEMSVAGLLRDVTKGRETVLDVVQDGDEQKVTFGHRDLLPEENKKARARARNHEFHSLAAFVTYLGREANRESAVVLADVNAALMTAALNEAEERDRESVSFAAKMHPLFEPWAKLIGAAPTVTEFALFVMQNRNAVLDPDGRELALMFSQVKAAKSITKHVGVGPKTLNGVMVEMQIGTERNEVPIELPERITISAPLFLDTDPVDIHLDLLVTEAKNGDIVVFVTAPELEEQTFKVFQHMVDKVATDTELIVGLGRVQERDWRLVE